ncbi:hypothetical protein GCM10007939_01890 [Amylibacter marinus]|uniref:Entericidin B n=1 Tax=Amylibacter marinus TaxID=1475483 RepID=A0ABQ5VRV5_9RHOB|nr:entericidin A/B family lipoprotein [Amylibacter marinus]GLQ33906.1 hypothetical protein GCM10007939_01890 [Amylibacter marinus]
MKNYMKSLICIGLICTLSACATVDGVGRDLNSAGRAISNSAQKVGDAL